MSRAHISMPPSQESGGVTNPRLVALADAVDNRAAQDVIGLGQTWFISTPTHATNVADVAALQAEMNAAPIGAHVVFPGGTYVLDATISFPSRKRYSGSFNRDGTTFKAAAASNLDALWASATWLSASTTPTSAPPVHIDHICFDGNSSAQTGGLGHGLVGMNYYSTVEHIKVQNTLGDGIRWTSQTLAGYVISNTCVEVMFDRCQVSGTGLNGLHLHEGDTTGRITDSWVVYGIFQGTLENGIYIENAAGTVVFGNHTYGTMMNGYRIGRGFRTRVLGNYAESFGDSATAGTYAGINMHSSPVITNGPVQICDNVLSASDVPVTGTSLYGIAVRVSTGATGYVTVNGNQCYGRTHTTSTVGIQMACQDGTGTLRGTRVGNTSFGWNTNYLMGSSGTYQVADVGNAGKVTAPATFTATPTIIAQRLFDTADVWQMTLTGNVTTLTLNDGTDGQRATLIFVQDATGGRTVAWPANVVNPPTVASAAGAVTVTPMVYLASTDLWYCL